MSNFLCSVCGRPSRFETILNGQVVKVCGGDCAARTEAIAAPSSKPETIAVPVELVRELKGMLAEGWIKSAKLITCLSALPEPPKPDTVEECVKAYATCGGRFEVGHVSESRIRAALRRYRELGCPELE